VLHRSRWLQCPSSDYAEKWRTNFWIEMWKVMSLRYCNDSATWNLKLAKWSEFTLLCVPNLFHSEPSSALDATHWSLLELSVTICTSFINCFSASISRYTRKDLSIYYSDNAYQEDISPHRSTTSYCFSFKFWRINSWNSWNKQANIPMETWYNINTTISQFLVQASYLKSCGIFGI
jgi:hypothetical protein